MPPHAPPRGLTAEEAEAWARVAQTVKPINPPGAQAPDRPKAVETPAPAVPFPPPKRKLAQPVSPPAARPGGLVQRAAEARKRPSITDHGLDSHWDKRIDKGGAAPDFTLDLHGHTLDSAHRRLDQGLAQAKAMGARMVLVITGLPRPAQSADRGERRGAIRAKILDWLAAGPHESDIAAIRPAHRKHGGPGALYVVLRRRR